MQADPSKLFPLWDMGAPASAPLGLPMCQNRLAIPTWSYVMERLPPARIIELGTFSGGFIVALAVHAYALNAQSRILSGARPEDEVARAKPCEVITYDRAEPDERLAPLGKFLGVDFRVKDLYAPATEAEIAALIRKPGTTFVLCDGGDKPREVATYAACLKSGDVIASHDYAAPDGPQGNAVYWPCGEITLADGERAAAENDLEPFFQDHFDLAAWLVYRKRVHS